MSSSTPRRPGTRCACSACPRPGPASSRPTTAGASCLGPHSGLKMQEARFRARRAGARRSPRRPSCPGHAPRARSARRGGAHARRSSRRSASATSSWSSTASSAPARPARSVALPSSGAGRRRWQPCRRPCATLPRDEVPLRGFDMVGLPGPARAAVRPGSGDVVAAGPAGSASAAPAPDLDRPRRRTGGRAGTAWSWSWARAASARRRSPPPSPRRSGDARPSRAPQHDRPGRASGRRR